MINTHPELNTLRDYIRYAITCFNEAALYFGHGTDNAWDEALALILPTLHLPHDINAAVLGANLIQSEKAKIAELINQRVTKRIPTPYLTHQAWFCGLPFYVDERVLIPRSSIGELIKNHFEPWIDTAIVADILDLCTGSGCIAVAAAKYFPEANIDASDISQEALAVAKINTLRHQVEDQVQLFESDLFNDLPVKQYDIIISNPPYVSSEEMETLPAEYLHEPHLGLSGGEEGLAFIARILTDATKFLKPHGILVVEVGNSEDKVADAFPELPFTWLSFENGEGGVFLLTAEQL